MVLSMSECPNHCCTVRRSTPAQRHFVANVARNLCNQKLSGSSLVRLTAAFRQSRKSSLGLHPAVGNTRAQPLDAFAFHAFKLFASLDSDPIGAVLAGRSMQSDPAASLQIVHRILNGARLEHPTKLNGEGDAFCTHHADVSLGPIRTAMQPDHSFVHAGGDFVVVTGVVNLVGYGDVHG